MADQPKPKAVKEEAPLDRVQSLTSELQQLQYGLQHAQSGGDDGQSSHAGAGGGAGSPGDDDVIDAEFDRS